MYRALNISLCVELVVVVFVAVDDVLGVAAVVTVHVRVVLTAVPVGVVGGNCVVIVCLILPVFSSSIHNRLFLPGTKCRR